MGKASSAKKVARAARAGGNRRPGQRRALGFPVAVAVVIVVGLLLVFFARQERNANAFPRANEDHVHSAVDVYTCVTQPADTGTSTTTSSTTATTTATASGSEPTASTTTTAPADTTTTTSAPADTTTTTTPTSTTQMAANDVHGEFQAPLADVKQDTLGIHSHGDGLMHIHPFVSAAAGRNATLGVFLDQVGVTITDSTLTLPDGTSFTEGTTKCEGGKDAIVQVAKWDSVLDAAKGARPNRIFTSDFNSIRLGENQAYMIAFMPEGSTFVAKPDVAERVAQVIDLPGASSAPPPSTDSGAPSTVPSTSSDAGTTTSTAASSSSG